MTVAAVFSFPASVIATKRLTFPAHPRNLRRCPIDRMRFSLRPQEYVAFTMNRSRMTNSGGAIILHSELNFVANLTSQPPCAETHDDNRPRGLLSSCVSAHGGCDVKFATKLSSECKMIAPPEFVILDLFIVKATYS